MSWGEVMAPFASSVNRAVNRAPGARAVCSLT